MDIIGTERLYLRPANNEADLADYLRHLKEASPVQQFSGRGRKP